MNGWKAHSKSTLNVFVAVPGLRSALSLRI